MGNIPTYANYFLTEKQIEELHKKEIWNAFKNVNYDFDKLLDFQKGWLKKYYPGKNK